MLVTSEEAKFIFPSEVMLIGTCFLKIPKDRSGKSRASFKMPGPKRDYGSAFHRGEEWAAHRLSFHLNVSKIPRKPKSRGKGWVLHHCDNKWCINPAHLYLGTAKNNAQDNARRNAAWREKRREIQKRIGFPEVSKEGRARMAKANSIRMKRMWKHNPEEARKQRGIAQ